MHLAFIGFGLIGGSIARAVRDRPVGDRPVRDRPVRDRPVRDRPVREGATSSSWRVRAWSPTGDGPVRAVDDGVIDAAPATPEETLAGADLVVLAGPASACLAALDNLAGPWQSVLQPRAVITDVASTKAALLDRADAAGLRYVGGHPMAGLETSGYAAARADLFVDRPWVIVPGRHADAADVDRVVALAEACRARVVRMDAETHDRAVAGISHLPLVLAAALVEAVAGVVGPDDDWDTAKRLAAGGWRDMTRLARGDPAMGASIAVTNAPALAARLRDLRLVLDEWLAALERPGGPDEAELRERLRAAGARLEEPS